MLTLQRYVNLLLKYCCVSEWWSCSSWQGRRQFSWQ